jgi:hypothetical protein
MERKDYAERILDIKNEIIEEIRKLVPEDSAHRFSDKFYVHFIEGEIATTEVCSAVEVWHGGMVVFIVNPLKEFAREEVIEGATIYKYEPESFLDILNRLKKEIREKKLQTLREIVKNNQKRIEFDNKFRFNGISGGCLCEHIGLLALYLDDEGNLLIEDEWEDGIYTNEDDLIPDSELDRIIEYVECHAKPKFSIRAVETRSRTFEFYAGSYEEALELVKKELEKKPLNEEDSDGFEFL